MSDQLERTATARATPDVSGHMTATAAFNGTIVSSAICAAFELGLLAELHEEGGADRDKFSARQGLDSQAFDAVLLALQHAAVVQVLPLADASVRIVPGAGFDDAWSNKGYFLWLLGGYGTMISHAAELSRDKGQQDPHYTRDGSAIARAGRDYGGQFVDPLFDGLVEDLGFKYAVDLGCGSAGRLISLARRHPAARFLGVDIDAGAVQGARATVAEAGLDDRIEIVQADIGELSLDAIPDVDLVFSFFMMHDLLPHRRFLGVLEGLRRTFPNVQALLLADTYRSTTAALPQAPIFTLGFEYTHGLMRQHLPCLDEWKESFASSVWDLTATHELGIADSVVFQLTPTEQDRRSS